MRLMRRLALALVIAVAASGPAAAVERILRFVSDVEVERNGDLLVTESIRVQVDQIQIRHGIFRDFPTAYKRPDGSPVVVGFSVQSVTRDGLDERWTTQGIANGMRVIIGREEILLTSGLHEYVIRYRTTQQIGFFSDSDELYWNATGNGWPFAIESAEVRITLPQAVPFGQTALYTGPQGARGQDAAIVERRDGHIVFRTTKPLPANNGLTVAAAWPKGIVIPPTASELWLADNLPGIVASAGLAAVLAFYGFAWLKVGRDPRRGTIIPLFGPPEGMSAAAVRYVERMGFDPKCFTAAIIDLGVNGHIKLTGRGKKIVIERCDGGKPVPAPERSLEGKLFASKSSLLLDQANYEPIGKAKNALKDGLVEAYDGTLFTDNYLWSGLGLVLSIILLGATLLVMINTYDSERASLLLVGMLVPTIPIAGGAYLIRAARHRDSYGGLFIGLGLVLVAGATLLGLAKMVGSAGGPLGVAPGVAAYIVVPLALLGFRWLQAPTVKGRAIMDQIEGFRQYLGVAEEDRLNALNPPDKTPELFERFLPYAIALDVENRWAKRFAAVLAAAGAGAAAGAAVGTWYSDNSDWGHDPVGFANQLGGALSQTIAAASTAPGSGAGGSGGGGSSGDGGGGGGGGGW